MHVYARLRGHGLTIVPRGPYRFERGDRDELTMTDGRVRRSLTISRATDVSVAAAGLGHLADVTPGPADAWRVETSVFSVLWPESLVLQSPPDETGPSQFDLYGADEALIYLQGPLPPERIPRGTDLVAAGQTLLAVNDAEPFERYELEYDHDRHPWRQLYIFVPFESRILVVVSQAPAHVAPSTNGAARTLAESARRTTA
jgi:hypothetical protein